MPPRPTTFSSTNRPLSTEPRSSATWGRSSHLAGSVQLELPVPVLPVPVVPAPVLLVRPVFAPPVWLVSDGPVEWPRSNGPVGDATGPVAGPPGPVTGPAASGSPSKDRCAPPCGCDTPGARGGGRPRMIVRSLGGASGSGARADGGSAATRGGGAGGGAWRSGGVAGCDGDGGAAAALGLKIVRSCGAGGGAGAGGAAGALGGGVGALGGGVDELGGAWARAAAWLCAIRFLSST